MLNWFLSLLDEFRRNFRVADAIDVLLMSILLYSGLVWFKETASRRVVMGVSVVAAIYILARALDMYLTSLVFHTAFAVVLIVLIVIFQEDLRRMFELIATWGTLRGFRPRTPLATDVDTLIESAFHLAAAKTGALIVIQGKEPLERHLNGGVRLGGRVSKPLLYSIFDSSSPGHDGAVIIQENRVDRFGAHLPISKNHQEIRGRGTRHSAALGLSECCDALTIVVSEERGVVSMAQKGRLQEVHSAAVLKQGLEKFLEDNHPQELESTWQRFITRHGHLKLLAVAIAIVAWFVLAYNPSTVQRTFIVPIEYRDLPQALVLDENAPSEARLTLTGSERQFRFLEPGTLKISLDLSDADEGMEEVSISYKDLRPQTSLAIDRIEPRVFGLYLRKKTE